MLVVYYSLSGNVRRFVDELGFDSLNVNQADNVESEFVLVTPTYTDRIPAPVQRFLDKNKDLCLGVVGSGNRNFGSDYCAAANNIMNEYGIPVLYQFEVFGLPQDVKKVREICHLQTKELLEKVK